MIYHITVGDLAAAPLKEAIGLEASMQGEVFVLKDILHVGPILKDEGTTFSEMRSAFWQQVIANDKNPVEVNDMEKLLELSNEMFKDENIKAWVWIAPNPADVCAYFWMLKYLSKHMGRLYIVNVANLPFLDENGKVFYPKSLSEIQPKELVKARRLARQVTPAEVEIDTEDWKRIMQENSGIRSFEGGKKLVSRSEEYYDDQLVSFCSQQFQKASRIIGQAISKFGIPTGDVYLGWRLRKMAEAGRMQLQGDISKMLKDYDVKLPGDATATTAGI